MELRLKPGEGWTSKIGCREDDFGELVGEESKSSIDVESGMGEKIVAEALVLAVKLGRLVKVTGKSRRGGRARGTADVLSIVQCLQGGSEVDDLNLERSNVFLTVRNFGRTGKLQDAKVSVGGCWDVRKEKRRGCCLTGARKIESFK